MTIDEIISSKGPMVDVTVGPSILTAYEWTLQGVLIPAPVTVIAMIDTGAAMTMLTPSLVEKLGLIQYDSKKVLTATGMAECGLYEVSLSIGDYEFPSRTVGEALQEFTTEDVLIGRDILNEAVFHYDGPRGRFTLRID